VRKQWFGDTRDYVKWNFVFSEAQPDYIVCYIAMARPDEISTSINPTVRAFFERYKNLELAGEMFVGRFRSLLREYEKKDAVSYFDDAEKITQKAKIDGHVVIFIDPDTGIEPIGKTTEKHVRLSDLFSLATLLREKDKLIVYQHAPRIRKPTWFQDSINRVLNEKGCRGFRVRHHYDPSVASDVFFLVIER
jgi:hypothetical protein